MSHQAEAEENLRVIRSLMEKATVYRAISAPGALIAGICAAATSIGARWLPTVQPGSYEAFSFFFPWLGALAIAGAANLLLLARDARRRNEPFLSSGMRLAVRAMLPSLVAAGVLTLPLFGFGSALLPTLWALFYGLSLLAASHFAPKSICWLGRAFFVVGCGSVLHFFIVSGGSIKPDLLAAHQFMGLTFGLFHLIYAACTWPRKAHSEAKP